MSRTRSLSASFSTRSRSAILSLVIVGLRFGHRSRNPNPTEDWRWPPTEPLAPRCATPGASRAASYTTSRGTARGGRRGGCRRGHPRPGQDPVRRGAAHGPALDGVPFHLWRRRGAIAIYQKATASKFAPVSSDAKALDGLNVQEAICDEIASHETAEVYDVLLTAMD